MRQKGPILDRMVWISWIVEKAFAKAVYKLGWRFKKMEERGLKTGKKKREIEGNVDINPLTR